MPKETININVLVIQGVYYDGISPITKEKFDTPSNGYRTYCIPIAKDMDEYQLKGYFRDRGFISSSLEAYNESRIYFAKEFEQEFIQLAESNSSVARTLVDLEASEDSVIAIMAEEERRSYSYGDDWSSMRCLYGCPMSNDVKSEISSDAEAYTSDDSIISETKISD